MMEDGKKYLCQIWGSRMRRHKSKWVPPIPKIISYKEAIIALEDVQSFLESRGHASTSFTYVGPAVDAISSLNVTCMRQRSLHDYCS